MVSKTPTSALASAAQLVGASSQSGSTCGQGTRLGCGFVPQPGRLGEGSQSVFLSHMGVSLSLSLPIPLEAMEKRPWVRIKKPCLIHF